MKKRRPETEAPGERRRRSAAELLGHAAAAGAEEALQTLVNQFADPLSFLRELVQNSLDAAGTRIEVGFSFEGQPGEATGLGCVSVADNGEGMNELIIDRYLLTLFASSKEDDLTKIGKFGIGFVSIFAIKPDLVVVETGQAGEAWRLIFHADARHEKLRLPDAVEGTVVRLFKRIEPAAFEELRAKGRETVRYWCKYAEAEILFDGEPLGEAFALDAALCARFAEPGTEILVGFAPPPLVAKAPSEEGGLEGAFDVSDEDLAESPRGESEPGPAAAAPTRVVGFYNRGLTLVEGPALPQPEPFFDGLSFRIKSRYLEHTLTRDNVLTDESYEKAIKLLRRLITDQLRPALFAHLEALASRAAEATAEREREAAFAWAALPSMRLEEHALERKLFATPDPSLDRKLFPTQEGAPVSLGQLRALKLPVGGVLASSLPNPVTQLLAGAGTPTLLGSPAICRYLSEVAKLTVLNADLCFATSLPTDQGEHAVWLAQVAALLDRCGLKVRGVHLGVLDYPGSRRARDLHLRQVEPFALTRIGHDDRPTAFGGARELVLAHDHPLVQRCLALSSDEPSLAAHLLAQGISILEGGAPRGAAIAARAVALDPREPADG
jgi:hypothetical protein